MVRYLFIDESGDLGMNGSRYLVLSCLIVSDEKPLGRIIKNARRHKFKKQLRKACEIKANQILRPKGRGMTYKTGSNRHSSAP